MFTDTNYSEKLTGANGVLMFYKKLCPACKALNKMLEKFFAANPDIPFMQIDSEECPEAVRSFEVLKIPTLFILKEGNISARKAGLMNLKAMADFYRSA
ncbi:MAG: thioredoxin family protein [Deltaproteobacteria bacterium]|nr:thioredoxin family protein [Deltaproteobacteria bacterium]